MGDPARSDDSTRELLDASAAFAQAFQRWTSSGGCGDMALSRMRVLEVLHCQGPAKLKSLADQVGMTARNLTAIADGLEADGLARRVDHPTDRRVTLLELTADGLAAAEGSLAPRLAQLGQIFGELSEAQRTDLLTSLRTVAADIERLAAG
ncbi:MAG: MarR family transcriptional regulator [Ilumatobacteraceae bacterium]